MPDFLLTQLDSRQLQFCFDDETRYWLNKANAVVHSIDVSYVDRGRLPFLVISNFMNGVIRPQIMGTYIDERMVGYETEGGLILPLPSLHNDYILQLKVADLRNTATFKHSYRGILGWSDIIEHFDVSQTRRSPHYGHLMFKSKD